MDELRSYQEKIVQRANCHQAGLSLPARVIEAFFRTPRHEFIDRFRDFETARWIELHPQDLHKHLPVLYEDTPLAIWGEDRPVSTISQPSFVLYQLALLEIQVGDRVFELGTGSGWNAALMGRLCAPGEVLTFEIIPDLAIAAAERLARMGIDNVRVIAGDGMQPEGERRFQKGIFTAGATDLPLALHRRMAPGGRLLFVLKRNQESDLLIVFDKTEDGFCSRQIIPCGFVPVTGTHAAAPVESWLSDGVPEHGQMRVVASENFCDRGGTRAKIWRRSDSTFIWEPRDL